MKMQKVKKYILALMFIIAVIYALRFNCFGNQQVSAPLMTDSAGKAGQHAVSSVFRIFCLNQNRMGTGFLHKTGWVITAAHVVKGCSPKDVFMALPQGEKINVKDILLDNNLDVAILSPGQKILGQALPISYQDVLSIGAQVSTWGFPVGYNGALPMLSVGYLSGFDEVKTKSGKIVKRLVVNAAFNSGNSGGPLVDIDTGSVIGIVSSKLAPIPPYIEGALKALKEQKYGMMFKKTKPDGTIEDLSQAQLLEEILQYMRSQTQLVVGRAILAKDIRSFLTKHKIEP